MCERRIVYNVQKQMTLKLKKQRPGLFLHLFRNVNRTSKFLRLHMAFLRSERALMMLILPLKP